MKTLFPLNALAAVLCTSLLFSCTNNDNDNETLQTYAYCVYAAESFCAVGPFTTCQGNGILSNACPYGSSSSVQPSSSSSISYSPSSSSGFNGNSSSGGGVSVTSGTFIDSRDGGKTYKWVKIGEQYWMAENLNYNASGSRCYGDNTGDDSQGNCAIYGRLYDWATAMGISTIYNSSSYNPSASIKYRGVCPEGWHIPSDAEWDKLMTSVGGSSAAGKHLKAKEGWHSCGPSGSGKSYSCEDTHGFSALPGGYGNSDGSFNHVGDFGYWWSASEYISYYAYSRDMDYYSEDALYNRNSKLYLFSVRCLQD